MLHTSLGTRRTLARCAALALAAALILPLGPSPAAAQPVTVFAWQKFASINAKLFHRATAYDSVDKKLYLYGGFDLNGNVRNQVDAVDLSAALAGAKVDNGLRPAGAIAELWGAAGAFRAKGVDRKIYWIGGTDATATPFKQLQVHDLVHNTWTAIKPEGAFDHRVLAAAVYDPNNDVVVVQGGNERCIFFPTASIECDDPYNDTLFLQFDALTGAPRWVRGPSGPRLFGATAAFDSRLKRILLFGGTYDRIDGTNEVWTLDMTSSDYVNSKWQKLAFVNTGSLSVPGGRALHTAAYNADLNHLVVYGGDVKTIHSTSEIVAAAEVWALDLGVTPPVWRNLKTPLGDRIGASMIYDPVHKTPILYGGRGKLRTGRQTVSGDLYALTATEVVRTPTPTAVPTVSPYGPLEPRLCPTLNGRVPPAVIQNALANPADIGSFGQPSAPNRPPSPANPPKIYLGLTNINAPYNPLFNPVTFKAGCP